METITAISSGEYSDYGINYLCKTEDDARKIMERLGNHYNEFLEEFNVVTFDELVFRDTLNLSVVLNCEQGTFEQSNENPSVTVYLPGQDVPLKKIYWQQRHRPYDKWNRKLATSLHVFGDDPDRIRQIFSDRKAELLANPQIWTEDRAGEWTERKVVE